MPDVKNFFGISLYLAEICCKNPQSVRGCTRQLHEWRAQPSIVPFFNGNNLPPPRQFLLDKIVLKKKSAGGNAH